MTDREPCSECKGRYKIMLGYVEHRSWCSHQPAHKREAYEREKAALQRARAMSGPLHMDAKEDRMGVHPLGHECDLCEDTRRSHLVRDFPELAGLGLSPKKEVDL